ncbi:uncharacterized protein LOC122319363 isoform X1 [Carya illinoinensis]|uniref:uncharacterized protein LOC122319363 isoform X1 n=1 Tax=Carya illinoinensis TaxID=32201 RepID=UPI001C71CF4F|nr:uncharacterized protein LOC122319363 isoform X1 [Carya illinoinensis]
MDPFLNTLHMLDEDYVDHEDLMIEAMALHIQPHAAEGAFSSRCPNSQPRMFIQCNPHESLWKVETHDDYFVQKRDASGRLGLSSLQKMTMVIRMLAYRVTADLMHEYVRIGESITRLNMKKFVKAIVSIFGGEYLRSTTRNDIVRLLEVGQRRGILGMLGSIDCMH